MPSIHITASREYDVLVQCGVLKEAGKRIAEVTGIHIAAIISDDIVFQLYGETLKRSLEEAGFQTVSYVFPHGEQHKSLETYENILYFLSEHHFTRSDILIALGGGITGDITGFAAATYQRGIPFIQIPTTLLAAVDSSVGGKTAINLRTGKNQVGSFYQPSLVLCDPEVLITLPEDEYRCGCAEVIKYAVLGSAEFSKGLKETPVREQTERVIEACVTMKRDIVSEDEFDRGKRQLLNLGHTVGHAVEACSGFSVLHGQAVSIGMAVITRAAAEKGICTEKTLQTVLDLLNAYELPTETEYSLSALSAAAMTDKKLSGSMLTLVVPEEIGLCRLETIPKEDLSDWLRAGGIV